MSSSPLSFLSVRLPGFWFLHSIYSFPCFSPHSMFNLTVFPFRDSWISLRSFPFQATDGLRKYLPACGLLQTSCILLALSLSHIFHFTLNTQSESRGRGGELKKERVSKVSKCKLAHPLMALNNSGFSHADCKVQSVDYCTLLIWTHSAMLNNSLTRGLLIRADEAKSSVMTIHTYSVLMIFINV